MGCGGVAALELGGCGSWLAWDEGLRDGVGRGGREAAYESYKGGFTGAAGSDEEEGGELGFTGGEVEGEVEEDGDREGEKGGDEDCGE